MSIIEFIIPGKLQAKQRPRMNGATRRMYTKRETRIAEAFIREHFSSQFHTHQPFRGPVSLEIEFYREPPVSWAKWRQRAAVDGLYMDDIGADLDNKVKTISDALNNIAYKDDRQIVSLCAKKTFAHKDYTYIRIQEYEQAAKPDA